MNIKEKIIGNAIVMLSTRFNTNELNFVQNVLTICFQNIDCVNSNELPSTEIVNKKKKG